MTKIKKLLIVMLVLFIAWVALFVYSNPVIGISRENLEQKVWEKVLEHGHIEEDWKVAQSINDSVAVFLFYDEETRDYVYTTYVNYPEWYSFGYFGQGYNKRNQFVEQTVEGQRHYPHYDDFYRVFSMNKPQIARIEYGTEGSTTAVIEVAPDQPFVAILPQDYGTITLYDREGNLVPLEYVDTPLTFVFVDRSE